VRERSYELVSERLGPLPIVNHVLSRIGVAEILDQFVVSGDRRIRLPAARSLGVLLRSIIVEREPVYRQQEVVAEFSAAGFGLSEKDREAITDDRLGRALDRLFLADRGTLLTRMVVAATQAFAVRLDELHNDSTSISFAGQYREARGRRLHGKRAPCITYGFSKLHRPDLKQLLFILTTSADGGVAVQFRCEDGNTNDSVTHIQTWDGLVAAAGRSDFLYVGDSKLCSDANMHHLDGRGGRFVTVMPRSRTEDEMFRRRLRTRPVTWEKVWDRPNPRRKYGLRDRWFVYRWELPSQEGWPVTWVYSTLLALHHKQSRMERVERACQAFGDYDERLRGPRPRPRSRRQIEKAVDETLERFRVSRYVRPELWEEELERFRQDRRGRPGPQTRYRKETRRRLRLRWTIDTEAIRDDELTDGMYPLLSNDRNLSPRQVLEAHKRQPTVEKRFQQIKTVHEIAPVFLKNEGRIEAFFFLYFVALLVQSIIEREVRRAMAARGIRELPIYPEDRNCRHPTAEQILRLFSLTEAHVLRQGTTVVQTFQPRLTELQCQILALLNVPAEAYQIGP
jgi:transposase